MLPGQFNPLALSCRLVCGDGMTAVIAYAGGEAAGWVAVREENSTQVSVASLYVMPGLRCRGAGRQIMVYVLNLYPHADIWLYAQPFGSGGPPQEILQDFYSSLGFRPVTDAAGRPAMCRPGSRSISPSP